MTMATANGIEVVPCGPEQWHAAVPGGFDRFVWTETHRVEYARWRVMLDVPGPTEVTFEMAATTAGVVPSYFTRVSPFPVGLFKAEQGVNTRSRLWVRDPHGRALTKFVGRHDVGMRRIEIVPVAHAQREVVTLFTSPDRARAMAVDPVAWSDYAGRPRVYRNLTVLWSEALDKLREVYR